MAVEKYGKLGITYSCTWNCSPAMDGAKLLELQKLIHGPSEAVSRAAL